MKKLLLLVCTVFCSINYGNAQTFSAPIGQDIYVIPAELTTSGKSVVTTRGGGNYSVPFITIYDEDFNEVKTIEAGNLVSESYTEKTTVPVTGINVKNEPTTTTPTYDWISNVDVSTITTAEEFAIAMHIAENGSYIEGYLPNFTAFVDYNGNLCCRNVHEMMADMGGYFDNDTRYPVGSYYSIIDGAIVLCSHAQSDYEYQYSLADAVWTETYRTSQLVSVLTLFKYRNFDNHLDFQTENQCAVTQSLFNNDDAWEYIVPDLYETTDMTYGSSQKTAEGITIYRTIKKGYTSQGYKIVSDDGRTIAKFNMPFLNEVWKLNGKIYLYGHGLNGFVELPGGGVSSGYSLYSFDSLTNEIKEVLSSKQRNSFVSVSGGTIDLQLSNEDTDSEAVITSMGGQTTSKYPIAKGHTYVQINAANLSKGIYNVSVQRNGQVLQSQNVLIQ